MWSHTSALSSFPSAASRSAATGPAVFGSAVSSSGNVGSRDDVVTEVDETSCCSAAGLLWSPSTCRPFTLKVTNIRPNETTLCWYAGREKWQVGHMQAGQDRDGQDVRRPASFQINQPQGTKSLRIYSHTHNRRGREQFTAMILNGTFDGLRCDCKGPVYKIYSGGMNRKWDVFVQM